MVAGTDRWTHRAWATRTFITRRLKSFRAPSRRIIWHKSRTYCKTQIKSKSIKKSFRCQHNNRISPWWMMHRFLSGAVRSQSSKSIAGPRRRFKMTLLPGPALSKSTRSARAQKTQINHSLLMSPRKSAASRQRSYRRPSTTTRNCNWTRHHPQISTIRSKDLPAPVSCQWTIQRSSNRCVCRGTISRHRKVPKAWQT